MDIKEYYKNNDRKIDIFLAVFITGIIIYSIMTLYGSEIIMYKVYKGDYCECYIAYESYFNKSSMEKNTFLSKNLSYIDIIKNKNG